MEVIVRAAIVGELKIERFGSKGGGTVKTPSRRMTVVSLYPLQFSGAGGASPDFASVNTLKTGVSGGAKHRQTYPWRLSTAPKRCCTMPTWISAPGNSAQLPDGRHIVIRAYRRWYGTLNLRATHAGLPHGLPDSGGIFPKVSQGPLRWSLIILCSQHIFICQ